MNELPSGLARAGFTNLAIVPLVIPLLTAALTALFVRLPRLQRATSALGMAALLLGAALILDRASEGLELRLMLGGWPSPFGIEFVVDRLGAALIFITALMGSAMLVFETSSADVSPKSPYHLPMIHGLLGGVGASFATGDLFNLYVWFELILMTSVGVLALRVGLRRLDATFKYLLLSLFGTLLLLTGVGLLYGATGHLNFGALRAVDPSPLVTFIVALIALAFLVKAGAFPFFAWLPASYPTLPAPTLALFAGLLTKVGAYAVLRLFGDVFAGGSSMLGEALGWLAAVTMIVGVLGAAYHWDIRRILAFHIISQVGYILLGVALGTKTGYAAAIFYTLHHILVKANLFFAAGVIAAHGGSYDLRRLGGLYRHRPGFSALFLVPALSLVGVPPLSGFWAKFLLLREAIVEGRVAWTVVGLVVSGLTLYSMMKIWMEAFWKAAPEDPSRSLPAPEPRRMAPALAVIVGLAAVTVAIGLWPDVVYDFASLASHALGARRG